MAPPAPERDWKYMKKVKEELLAALCKQINGQAMVANPAIAGETRLSWMKWRACGNVSYGGIRNPPHIPKGCGSETLCL